VVTVTASDDFDDMLGLDPSEARQRALKAWHPEDDVLIPITARQCSLIAGFIGAAIRGHDVREPLAAIEGFLMLASATTTFGPGHLFVNGMDDPNVAWESVEGWPLPPAGTPGPQPA
jgi:hypothetical protein